VKLVLFDIGNIVDDIDPAAHNREKRKSLQGEEKINFVEEVTGKYEGSKEEEILDPLLDPHGGEDVSEG
jgi:hypothetical protein